MRGKWEKEREKKPWIAILTVLLAVILLTLFLTKDLWNGNKAEQPANEAASTDMTADDDSTAEQDEAENEVTEPAIADPEMPETDAPETETVDDPLEVVNAYVSNEDHLILVYSNGKEMDTGPVEMPADNTQEKFKVVFQDYNGAVLKEEYVGSGESATPPAVPVMQGFDFVGWDGSYTDITADITLSTLYVPSSEETVTYTVRFVDYDDVVLKTETVMKDGAATAPGSPLRNGYEFTGWDKPFDKVTSDLTVKAQYEAYTGPEVVIEEVEAAAGSEDVAVTLRVKNNPGIVSLKFLVTFGNELTLTKIEYNPELGGQSMMPQTMGSPVTLNWVSPFEDKTGDWVFVTLYFTVADSA